MSGDSGLRGEIAIVTGGTRGIGLAIATALAREGAIVVVCSRRPENVEQAAAQINAEYPGQAVGIPCHVGQMASIEALFEQVCAEVGVPRVLVNNAGTNPYFGPMLGAEWSAWDKTFDVNLKGPFHASRVFAQKRFETGDTRGSIVCISSILGLRAAPHQGIYGMTKAAMISMTQSFASENGRYGIRVNALCPGITETTFTAVFQENEQYGDLINHMPLKRAAQPIDMVGASLLMVSDAGACMTGQTLVVNGGSDAF